MCLFLLSPCSSNLALKSLKSTLVLSHFESDRSKLFHCENNHPDIVCVKTVDGKYYRIARTDDNLIYIYYMFHMSYDLSFHFARIKQRANDNSIYSCITMLDVKPIELRSNI